MKFNEPRLHINYIYEAEKLGPIYYSLYIVGLKYMLRADSNRAMRT